MVFSAVLWPRWPYEVLQHAIAGDFQLVLSPRIIEEATRAVVRVAPANLRRLDAALEASRYEEIATPTDEEIAANLKLSRDAKDVHGALVGIKAQVDCLVSLDKDPTAADAQIRQYLPVVVTGCLPARAYGLD